MRGLFRWALKAQLRNTDPTAGVDNPVRKGGEGFTPWTEEQVAAYEARWPIGKRQRVWLAVLLYTGLRRGDAVRLGRQHVCHYQDRKEPLHRGGRIADPASPASNP
jgi:site-specific recombinase XerD